MYYTAVNKSVTGARNLNLSLLLGSCNTAVREFVTLSPTVSATVQKVTLRLKCLSPILPSLRTSTRVLEDHHVNTGDVVELLMCHSLLKTSKVDLTNGRYGSKLTKDIGGVEKVIGSRSSEPL